MVFFFVFWGILFCFQICYESKIRVIWLLLLLCLLKFFQVFIDIIWVLNDVVYWRIFLRFYLKFYLNQNLFLVMVVDYCVICIVCWLFIGIVKYGINVFQRLGVFCQSLFVEWLKLQIVNFQVDVEELLGFFCILLLGDVCRLC